MFKLLCYVYYTGGDATNSFMIDPQTGHITTTSTLDYETALSYSLSVVAHDRDSIADGLSQTADVTIQIINVNEYAPVFSETVYSRSISENQGVLTSIVKVKASDDDAGEEGTISYLMDIHPQFTLDSATGELYLKTHLDYEVQQQYVLNVMASDGGVPALSSTCQIEINVLNENDNNPDCSPSTYWKSVREDLLPGSPIVQLMCADQDAGLAGTLKYSIQSVNGHADDGIFTLSPNGTFILSQTLDYENENSYNVEVLVDDMIGSPSPVTVTVVLRIIDVNEFAPSFLSQPQSVNIKEDAAVGSVICTISASDGDTNDDIEYSLTPPIGNIDIESNTGKLVLTGELDYETLPVITIMITAEDSGMLDSPKSSTHAFTINVVDINDNPPVFTQLVYAANLVENAVVGATVSAVSAVDIDGGTYGIASFNIINGNDGNVFRIDGNTNTGEAFIVVADDTFLDFETTSRYELHLEAVDGGNKRSDATVVVNIDPFNEHPPIFTPSQTYSLLVHENVTVGSKVGAVLADDADGGPDGEVEYFMHVTHPNFKVDRTSGTISTSWALDAETSDLEVFQIVAMDKGVPSLSSTATVTVSIIDVNDNSPQCQPSVVATEIMENSPPATFVARLNCIDTDNDPNLQNNAITYKVLNDASDFVIDTQSGEVRVAPTADIDADLLNKREIEVLVMDNGMPTLTTTATVLVTIKGKF